MDTTTIFTIPDGETFQSFAQLNNFLIIITDLNRYFLIWDYDTEAYVELEDIPMPLMYFEEDLNATKIDSSKKYTEEDDDIGWLEKIRAIQSLVRDEIKVAINARKDDGKIRGCFLLRVAFQLFDGSYIKQSGPHYIRVGSDGEAKTAFIGYPDRVTLQYIDISFGNVKYAYRFSTNDIGILEKYGDIIQSLDLFMTDITDDLDQNSCFAIGASTSGVNSVDYNTDEGWVINHSDVFDYLEIPDNPNIDQLIEKINYYKILSIPLQNLIDDPSPTSLIDLDFSDIKNLLTKETLPVDNFSHHNIWGQTHYNYNSRLHIGNITTKLFKGFYPFYWDYLSSGTTTYNYAIKTWIRTEQGNKIVIQYFDTPNFYAATTEFYFAQILFYPDSRAYKMRILQEDSANPGDYYFQTGMEFDLTPHPFLNFSYAFFNIFIEEWFTVPQATWSKDSLEDMTEEKYLTDQNRAQASRLDNALVNLAENSYQIGSSDNEIIGFGSVVEPLSEGQHGQFPLYVFTTQGMKALEQGNTGDILYSNIIDLNNEVCNNPKSILSIGGGVVFATDKGLKIISGRNVQHISLPAEGTPATYLTSDNSYQLYLDDEYLVELLDYVSNSDFLDYLDSGVLAYDHKNKEILVGHSSVVDKGFIWVYSLLNNTWTKRTDILFDQAINNYPDYLGYYDGILYDLTDEDDTEYVPVLIQTRPIKLDTKNYKKIGRMVQSCNLNVKEFTKSGMYVFGSIDGNSYEFLRGVQPDADGTFFDIMIKRINVSVRYIIIVFAGQLKDSEITFLEMEYTEKYGNKLR